MPIVPLRPKAGDSVVGERNSRDFHGRQYLGGSQGRAIDQAEVDPLLPKKRREQVQRLAAMRRIHHPSGRNRSLDPPSAHLIEHLNIIQIPHDRSIVRFQNPACRHVPKLAVEGIGFPSLAPRRRLKRAHGVALVEQADSTRILKGSGPHAKHRMRPTYLETDCAVHVCCFLSYWLDWDGSQTSPLNTWKRSELSAKNMPAMWPTSI